MKNAFKFLAILLLTVNFTFAQDLSKKIDSIIKDSYQKNPDISFSLGFIQNNTEFYTAYGKLSKESEVDVNKNSVFEIASITKVLTGNLIAQAAAENKLNITDFIEKHLPSDYKLHINLRNKITISDLASHQSGLPDIDFRALISANSQQPMDGVTQETLSEIINNSTKLIDYGKYRYSTIGYVLLGHILENIYGKSYDEIITEKMITPLQLTNTFTENYTVKNLTAGYNPKGGEQEFMKWHITAPAGLVKSSAADMITFLKAILKTDNAINAAAQLAEKTYYNIDGRAIGLGVNINADAENVIFLKTGDSMGQTTIICYNREKNWGLILLMNKRDTRLKQELFMSIYDSLLK